uniref:Brain enriched myelin associated protein 1 n=1 Tax=Rousettus aegyptiacus TaxID=9407 RepID=A0A7J8DEV4_ROUAE|nr:brain enriched myelin associated protein 1 [Rousettus aegyptiacus]
MGNQMSVPQRVEDQENDSERDTYKAASGSECAQNGMIVSTRTAQHCDQVDLGMSVKEDNVAASSLKTVETSPVTNANGKDLGKEAKPEAPAAKSRFFLTLSRPVPGRTEDSATDSSAGSVKLGVTSSNAPGNKEPSDSMALPAAAAPGHNPDKTPGQTPAQHEGFSATWGPALLPPESAGAAPSKPKDSSFFDKLFKLDKGQEEAPVDSQQEANGVEHQRQADEIPGSPRPSDDVPAEGDIVAGKGEEGQEVTPVSCSIPGNSEELDSAKEDSQTTDITENNNSIMSFFKTLVSPNKAETKKDLEDTASKTESVCDGQAGQKTSEVQNKGTKKKPLHSPRLGLTFRKFFRHKGAEKSPVTSTDLKSDKGNFVPQETQGAAKNPAATETAKEGAKEKGGPTSLPLSKLFWKKISDSTDKAPTPPEPEPAGAAQKCKEGPSKDKKATAEVDKQKSSKQDTREPAPCAEPAAAEATSPPSTDKPQKRPERGRQSLGGFFKGLGPKRMLDAQVQTDPVSIGPVGKPK